MNKHIGVIHNIIPLLTTIEEGLNHIKRQVTELRYEEALGLLQDTMLGIASIESALELMKKDLPYKEIVLLVDTLKNNISKAVDSYEKGRQEQIEKQIEEEILPAFKNWKEKLERVLTPLIVS